MTVMFCSNSAEMMFADTAGSRALFIPLFSAILGTYAYWQYYDVQNYMSSDSGDENHFSNWNTVFSNETTRDSFFVLLMVTNSSAILLYASWVFILVLGNRLWTIPVKRLFITRALLLVYGVISPLVNLTFWIIFRGNCDEYSQESPWNRTTGGAAGNETIVYSPDCVRTSERPEDFWSFATIIFSCGPGFWVITSALYYRQEYALASLCVLMISLFIESLVNRGEFQIFGSIIVFGLLPTMSLSFVLGKVCLHPPTVVKKLPMVCQALSEIMTLIPISSHRSARQFR